MCLALCIDMMGRESKSKKTFFVCLTWYVVNATEVLVLIQQKIKEEIIIWESSWNIYMDIIPLEITFFFASFHFSYYYLFNFLRCFLCFMIIPCWVTFCLYGKWTGWPAVGALIGFSHFKLDFVQILAIFKQFSSFFHVIIALKPPECRGSRCLKLLPLVWCNLGSGITFVDLKNVNFLRLKLQTF